MMNTHFHFTIARRSLVDRVLIPKFYDPDLDAAALAASAAFELPRLGDVLLPGKAGSQLGVWLPRESYGGGIVPFVRTSDLYHWRIRPDFKKGVSDAVYAEYQRRVDLKPNDILLVAHGTYLVGDVALLQESDFPLLLQDHVFRLRLRDDVNVHPHLLLAALSTRFVRAQMRSRQFSAEIIDKLGDRHLGVRVSIPRDPEIRRRATEAVASVLLKHTEVRTAIASTASSKRAPGPRAGSHYGFRLPKSGLANRILIPRYYDPELEGDLVAEEVADGQTWTTIGKLRDDGLLSISTGVEVGKMAYGTGQIAFVRTSDLVDWELFRDPTQGVSDDVYAKFSRKGALEANDVLLVRDGTYLVGSSALVLKQDLPALFCGGLYRLRTMDKTLGPHALLGLLNLPLVRRQMRAKQFTRDVIDTLGPRLLEVRVPQPGSPTARQMQLAVATVMAKKGEIKTLMSEAVSLLEPALPPSAVGRPGWSMR